MAEGVVVIDKPAGMTSHDVVQRVRRWLGERRVGHAGTLDPMATGVLVVMVGEATKLAPFLTADDKEYLAGVKLGSATDTLDAEGTVTSEAPLPAWWASPEAESRIEHALAAERERRQQTPPAFSAIKLGGRTAHSLARKGERVELEPRPVRVNRLELRERDEAAGLLTLALSVSKGYYVRSLARDLGERLEIPAHLCSLQRLSSGRFDLERAVPLDPALVPRAVIPAADAARQAMPWVTLTPEGVVRARHGKRLHDEHFLALPDDPGLPTAWLADCGSLVAVGRLEDDNYAVLRGFR